MLLLQNRAFYYYCLRVLKLFAEHTPAAKSSCVFIDHHSMPSQKNKGLLSEIVSG